MMNDTILEIKNIVRDIRENQGWFDDSYYVEKLVNIMSKQIVRQINEIERKAREQVLQELDDLVSKLNEEES